MLNNECNKCAIVIAGAIQMFVYLQALSAELCALATVKSGFRFRAFEWYTIRQAASLLRVLFYVVIDFLMKHQFILP
jgi:hypothetical protein